MSNFARGAPAAEPLAALSQAVMAHAGRREGGEVRFRWSTVVGGKRPTAQRAVEARPRRRGPHLGPALDRRLEIAPGGAAWRF